jgi:hypothetical protein
MPFDAIPELPVEVRILDKALEILGPNGEHWAQGTLHDNGTYCMRGAIHSARRRLHIRGDKTEDLVFNQMRDEYGQLVERMPQKRLIEDFNDAPRRVFSTIRSIMMNARHAKIMQWERDQSRGHQTICSKLHARPNLGRQAAFRKRSFAQRDKLNGKSWDFRFQNPLSESSSKASGMREPSLRPLTCSFEQIVW